MCVKGVYIGILPIVNNGDKDIVTSLIPWTFFFIPFICKPINSDSYTLKLSRNPKSVYENFYLKTKNIDKKDRVFLKHIKKPRG